MKGKTTSVNEEKGAGQSIVGRREVSTHNYFKHQSKRPREEISRLRKVGAVRKKKKKTPGGGGGASLSRIEKLSTGSGYVIKKGGKKDRSKRTL